MMSTKYNVQYTSIRQITLPVGKRGTVVSIALKVPKSIWAGGFPPPPACNLGNFFNQKNVKTNLGSPQPRHSSNLANAQKKLLDKVMLFVLSVAMTKTLSPFATQDIVHQCNFILCIDKWSVQLSRICTCGKVCVRVSAVLQTRQGGGLFCICICTCGKVCVRVFTVLQTRCRGDGGLYLFL